MFATVFIIYVVQPVTVSTTSETFNNNRLFIRETLSIRYGSLAPYLNQTLKHKLIINIGGAEIGDINTVFVTNSYNCPEMSSIGRVRSRRPSLVEWTQHMIEKLNPCPSHII
ncbi:unnamed protein product [Wuchereria bancrofti]|uniref:Uncharacterized protein n=1 Tax=Wuchereria bancrofti TaxID=6293 RepID=A0A3P7FNG8_WUCBA|nr:unnamed protein product [Wuchereria bancrofti]